MTELAKSADLKEVSVAAEVNVGADLSDTITFELDHAKGTPRSVFLKQILPLGAWIMSKGSNKGKKQYIISKKKPEWKEGYDKLPEEKPIEEKPIEEKP
jgi:hypothetical protein